jgi:phosphoribosylformylglycinamidine (FGAM) synthase PurS component
VTIHAYVHRKTRDLVCDAADDGLRARWDSVRNVDRAEVWSFDVDGDEITAEAAVRGILEDTTLVVNPNVHRYTLDVSPGNAIAAARVTVNVHDLVDAKGASVLRTIRERRGLRAVTDVRRSVRWVIDVDGPASEAKAIAEVVTGQDGRGAGLLSNRHSQEVTIQVEGE